MEQYINPHNFFINRFDRNSHGGGVLTYINPLLKPLSPHTLQTKYNKLDLEVTISRVTIRSDLYAVLGVYRPPNVKASWFETFEKLLAELPKKLKLIIMGDLNCNLLLPNLSVTKKLQLLLEVANVCIPSHEVLPTRVTFGSASCLDFIAFDRSLTTTEYLVSDLLLSDHLPVIASLTIPSPPPAVPVLRRSFKSTDYLELGTKLDNIILTTPISINQLDEQLDSWYAEVGVLLDTYAPQRKYPRLNKAVPSNKITRDLTNQRNALSRRINKVDPSEKEPLLALINNLNKRIKSQTRASLKAAANDAVLNHQPKDMWKFINNAMFRKTKHSDINNQPEISQLNNFFGSLVEETRSIPTIGSPSTTPMETRINQPITPIETHTNEPITSN